MVGLAAGDGYRGRLPGSSVRDHEEKPPEYLAYGVGEYWVLDPDRPDRPGPSARIFTRNAAGDAWDDR